MAAYGVLRKSEKGHAELVNGTFNLDLKSRQILILADGFCTLERMQEMRPRMDVSAIVNKLVAEGYLHGSAVEEHRVSDDPPAKTHDISEAHPLPVETLLTVQNIIIESTREYIGLLGSEIIQKASQAQNIHQLKGCIAQWNMVLRDSRRGRHVADHHLNEVRVALGILQEG